jgi:thiamine biosynthesis lipoprotein
MSRKTSRRDFLRGNPAARALADAARGAAASGEPAAQPCPATDASYLIHVTRRAMACEFQVLLNAGQHASGTEAALEALDAVDALEEQLSVFRATSEISRINRTAAAGPVAVESRLFALLELAGRIHAETGGAFDITAGPLWEAWGFSRRQGSVPSQEQLAEAIRRVGWHQVELSPADQTVRFLAPGLGLNLGSIGKGYALDRAAEVLEAAGVSDYLLHGGQSSILARGSRLAGVSASEAAGEPSAPTAGWTIGVRHPLRPDRRLGEIRLRNQAVGTSGSGVQFFRHKGRRLGHILDPRTGQPAEGVLSTTVLAPTAAEADALATAFFVMGVDASLAYCRGRPEIAAVIVLPSRRAGGLEVKSAGLSGDRWKPLRQG